MDQPSASAFKHDTFSDDLDIYRSAQPCSCNTFLVLSIGTNLGNFDVCV